MRLTWDTVCLLAQYDDLALSALTRWIHMDIRYHYLWWDRAEDIYVVVREGY